MSIFENLHIFIRQIYISSFRKFKITWAILASLFLLSLSQIPNLRFLVMLSDLLDKDFKTYQQFQDLNANFTEENQVSVLIKSRAGELSQKQHCLIINWLNQVHLKQFDILRIFSTYGLKQAVDSDNLLKVKPILIPKCSEDYNPEEIKKQLETIAKSPSGHILTNKNSTDVFASFYMGNLSDEEASLLGHFNTKAFEILKESFNSSVLQKDNQIQIEWVGIGTYQYYLQKAYEQMNILNIITGILLLLCFKLLFKTWKSGVFFLVIYSVGLTLLYGFMGATHFPIDSLSAAVPIMLLISTLEDYIFFLVLFEKSRSIHKSFRDIIIPSFYTSLTTCLGFLSLTLSDLSIIRRFGITCAVGALLEWLLLFLVFPKILFFFKYKNKTFFFSELRPSISRLSQKMNNLKPPKLLGVIFLLPLSFFIFNSQNELHIKDSPEAIFPSDHPVPRATNELLKSRGWKSEISLVFNSNIEWSDQRLIITKIQKKIPEFVFYESFHDNAEFLTKDLKKESSKRFFKRNLKYDDSTERWISRKDSVERVMLFSNSTDVVRLNEIRSEVDKICLGKCYMANILVSYSEFGVKILKTLTKSFSVSLLVIIALLFALCFYFKIKKKFVIIITALWGPLVLLALFIGLDIGVYFATSVVMSVLVGLAGDNAFQFIFAKESRYDLNRGVERLSSASFISMVLMVLVSSCFFFSDFEGVRKIGLMMMSGFLLGWIGDVIILRSLIQKN